eukprot:186974-Prorocentrum_minimum.AAC.3
MPPHHRVCTIVLCNILVIVEGFRRVFKVVFALEVKGGGLRTSFEPLTRSQTAGAIRFNLNDPNNRHPRRERDPVPF